MSYSGVHEDCPRCRNHFIYSSLLEDTASYIKLHCRICDQEYRLPNTQDQRQHLSNEYAEPSQIDPLRDIRQLGRGDVIAYQRVAWVLKYQHHAVVTDVDYNSGIVKVVEFTPELPLRKGFIVRSGRYFDRDIKKENAFVRRYMPLDCLPVEKVVEKANSFITSPARQPKYDLFRCNCQHLSSWCKTGKMKSNEASRARWWYHLIFHGFQFASIFSNPVVAIGTAIYTAADTIVRVVRIYRTEFDLMEKEMKTPWEALGIDIGSLILSTVVGTAALVATGVASAASRR